jgi:acyl carrier protein
MKFEEFLVQEIKKISFKTVKPDESLIKSGLLTSITVIDLVVSIEDAYKVKISFTDITPANFDTIDLIIKFLNDRGISLDKMPA